MSYKYFSNPQTLEELKKEYYSLAKRNHPDAGGNTETMQAIINEYENLLLTLNKIFINEIFNWRHRVGDIGIDFNDNNEYYETLGYLSNVSHWIKIYWHNNQRSGAWGYQGKLERSIDISSIKTRPLKESFSHSGDHRLSVTAYVNNLWKNHNFTMYGDINLHYSPYLLPQNFASIRGTVPIRYLPDFDRGFAM